MPTHTLRDNLARLRAELAHPERLDGETRKELVEIADTIERVLHEPEPNYREASTNVESAALRFEARHPAFSRILSEITDALAKLGI
jgi:hypothetical protein